MFFYNHILRRNYAKMYGPLAQPAERGANNAKVMGSSPIRTIDANFVPSVTL